MFRVSGKKTLNIEQCRQKIQNIKGHCYKKKKELGKQKVYMNTGQGNADKNRLRG